MTLYLVAGAGWGLAGFLWLLLREKREELRLTKLDLEAAKGQRWAAEQKLTQTNTFKRPVGVHL